MMVETSVGCCSPSGGRGRHEGEGLGKPEAGDAMLGWDGVGPAQGALAGSFPVMKEGNDIGKRCLIPEKPCFNTYFLLLLNNFFFENWKR